jgi:hypothetical protein
MKILDDLIKTLEKAKQIETNLFIMDDWITLKGCGAAHCVIGWHMAFNLPEGFSFHEACPFFADELDTNLTKYVSETIWLAESSNRRGSAIESGEFSDLELMHPHLTSLSTFDDAISWIQLINAKELSV